MAYDVYHDYQPKHQWGSQYALSINGKRTDNSKDDLLTIGRSIRSKKAVEIIDAISHIVDQWKRVAYEVMSIPT